MPDTQQDSPFKGLINAWPALVALLVAAIGLVVAKPSLERTADAYGPPAEADGERQQRSRPALAGSACRGLERMQEEINNMNSGAFTSIYQNPIVVALMLPLGGGGGLAALSFLLGH